LANKVFFKLSIIKKTSKNLIFMLVSIKYIAYGIIQ